MTSMEMVRAGRDVTADQQLWLAQVFGPTFQGEGPTRGQLANFVRFAGCNLHCSWCDTQYTWNARAGMKDWCIPVPISDVVTYLRAHPGPRWVISGGEPLLHQHTAGIAELLSAADVDRVAVEVETNGTIKPDIAVWGAAQFNVSPKLAHAGDPERARIVREPLAAFSALAYDGRACFKFVATAIADLDEIAGIVAAHHLPAGSVWVMPEGTTPERVLEGARALCDPVLARGWNLTLRDHVLLWRDDPRR